MLVAIRISGDAAGYPRGCMFPMGGQVVGMDNTSNTLVISGAPQELQLQGTPVAAHVTSQIESWAVGVPMTCSIGTITPVVVDPLIRTVFYDVSVVTTTSSVASTTSFVIGGKIYQANTLQAALEMAGSNSQSGFEIVGRDEVRSFESLDPEAQAHYNTLSLLLMGGGSETLKANALRLFKQIDTNKDRSIDRNELIALVTKLSNELTLPQPDGSLVDHLLARYDKDGNGTIDQDEFPYLYSRMLRRLLAKFKVADKSQLLRASRRQFQEKYELGKRLNAGAQGVTYLATERQSGTVVVVKKPNQASDLDDFEKVRDKAHPNIVRVFELFTSPSETYVVMECCSGGDLFAGIKYCQTTFGTVPLAFCSNAMEQSMLGVRYIHSQFQECHNDIKPENVLLDRKPTSARDVPRFMIADFGCTSDIEGHADGDPRYNAPELWYQQPTSYATDVWALGVMMYEILSGGMLVFTDHQNISGWASFIAFENGLLLQKLQQRITQPGAQPDWSVFMRPDFPYGGDAVGLCQSLLGWYPQQRISLDQALQNQWFQVVRGKDVELPKDVLKRIGLRCDYSDLKMLLLNMVAAKLQGENLVHYQHLWDAFDTERRGTLSADKFREMLKHFGLWGRVAEDLSTLADIDASGDIDFNEFIAVMFNPDALSREALQMHLCNVFHDVSGGTRKISAEDLASAFHEGTSRVLIDRLFQQMDVDHNGHVNIEEFTYFLTAM